MGHLAWDAPYRPRRALLRERAEQAPEPVPPVITSATVPARGPTVRRARAALSAVSALSAAAAAASRPAPRSQKAWSRASGAGVTGEGTAGEDGAGRTAEGGASATASSRWAGPR